MLVCAPRRLGVALNFDMTKTPAPCYNDHKKTVSREIRANLADHNNMILRENRPDNKLHDHRWTGNGFSGSFQFMPYVGREPVRPGEKLQRDLQAATNALENSRMLNNTSMGRGKVGMSEAPSQEERRAHDEALSSLRNFRKVGGFHERTDNPHVHVRNELDLSTQRQARLEEVHKSVQSMRTAGLASINSRMGTCGSLPELSKLTGEYGLKQWRSSTPWAIEDRHVAPASVPMPMAFAHPL
eukprot:TRINITY_DN9727_c0_g1_i2.p1 TRINITY_DN9727_c0_g1~~TRINITY_DN9727_c0_g1_i2.p1  ORF type:complete len:242 (-),score=34.49 TRINITY_DN9727_c0_g1_i2:283-1008(-)